MRVPWCADEVYAAAAAFADRCLKRDDSLFTPGRAIATAENFESLQATAGVEDLSAGNFAGKLVGQLEGVDDDAIQLCAELLVFQLFGEHDTGGPKKLEHVEALLALLDEPPTLSPEIHAALHGRGVATFGVGKNRRDAYVRFLIRFCIRFKQFDEEARARLLADPWAFRAVVAAERTSLDAMQANSLLHLLFPDEFASVVSGTHRDPLLKAFASARGVAAEPDDDHRIGAIRRLVDEQLGRHVDFYDEPLSRIWLEESDPGWAEFVDWAARLYAREDFDSQERDYKLELADQLRVARESFERRELGWLDAVAGAFKARDQNLVNWRRRDRFLAWVSRESEAAARALEAVWSETDEIDGMRAFLGAIEGHDLGGAGGRLALGSFLQLAIDPTRVPIYKATVYAGMLKALERAPVDDPGDPMALYEDWSLILEELQLRMLAQGQPLRDTLDAQSLAYWVVQGPVPGDWPDDQRRALKRYRGEQPPDPPDAPPDHPDSAVLPPATAPLAERLLLPLPWLHETFEMLAEKRQLIFYGPPGTGKTYIAQAIGQHVEEAGGSYRLVQFHPSYTYEDFFEGYRPRSVDGNLSYELVRGPLRQAADAALGDPSHVHLLVIDELNRGNVAKIFGELYFLLEYRDRAVTLQYSERAFRLPDNLLVLGTMNTADRSIALVDSALRRRFYFQGLLPTRSPIDDVLRRWLKQEELDPTPADLLDALNAEIADEDFSIGPSYFITRNGTSPDLARVWRHALMPLLREHFYGRSAEDVERQFGLDTIRARVSAAADAASPDGDR